MNNPQDIRIEDYTYDLPNERIAKYPLEKRDLSKLLIYKDNTINQDTFINLKNHLPENSLLVFNNTKVIRARLKFKKDTGANIEIFCLEPINPSDFSLSLSSTDKCTWKCIVGNLKKWKEKPLIKTIDYKGEKISLTATKIGTELNSPLIEFSWDNNKLSFSEIVELAGILPIPPYLNRETEDSDNTRYQTVYSKHKGSVAAPTAGLHFTNEVINSLSSKNIDVSELTLHVGAGTFKPVKSDTIGEHEMHTEHFFVDKETLENIISKKDNIISVGTTSVRTLESLYWLGVKIISEKITNKEKLFVSQWDAYELSQEIETEVAIKSLLNFMIMHKLEKIEAATQIIIAPGYNFRVINGIVTNYHQPNSTLLLLIAALIGDNWKDVYKHAIDNDFRFLSYGDSSLLFKN